MKQPQYGLAKATQAHTLEILKNAAAQKILSQNTVSAIGKLTSLKNTLSGLGKAGWAGIIISALAAIGSYLIIAHQNSNRLKRELEDIDNKSLEDARVSIAGLNMLMSKLQDLSKQGKANTKEYSDVINQLNTRYGQFLPSLIKEGEAYDNIAKSVQSVTDAIYEKAKADAYAQKIAKIQESYSEDIGDRRDSVERAFIKYGGVGKEIAKRMTAAIDAELSKKDNKKLAGDLIPDLFNAAGVDTSTIKNIGKLSKAINLLYVEYYNLNKEISGASLFQGISGIYSMEIEKIDNELKKSLESIPKDAKSRERQIKADYLNKKIDIYKKYNQEGLVRQTEAELEATVKIREEWAEIAEEYSKTVSIINSKNITANSLLPQEEERGNIVKYLKRIAEEYERIKKDIEDLNNVPFPARGESWQESISRAKFEKQQYDSLIKSLGVDINSFGKRNKSETDSVADIWKKRIELVDKAIQSYNKWKEVEGKDASETRAKESDVYKQLASSGINVDFQNPQKTYEYIKSKLGNTDKQKELSLSIGVKIENYELDRAKEEVHKAVDGIQKYIEDKSKQWDLYKQLFEITGNKRESMLVAFQGETGFESYIEELKGKIKSIIGYSSDDTLNMVLGFDEEKIRDTFGETADEILKLQKELKQKMEEDRITSLIDEAKVIQKFATTAQKINTLNVQYIKKTGGIIGDKGAIELPENATEGQIAYFKEYKEELSKITDESVKLLPLWQNLFGDTTQMGYKGLVRLVDEAKKFADTAVKQENPITKKTEYVLTYKNNGVEEKVKLSLEMYLKLLEQIQKEQNDIKSQNPFKAITDGLKNLKEAETKSDKETALKTIGTGANEAAQMITEVTDAWTNMFSAFGNDELADTIGLVRKLTGELGKLAEGLTSGNPIQMASSALTFIPNIISSIARFHDKKLDKSIQRSALEVKKLQNAYKNLQSTIERQLGNITESQTQDMISNLQRQRQELEKQIYAEEDKKDSDSGKIEDYKQQIYELDEQLKYFYEDLAKDLYGIDLKSWASQFSDSLIDAWRNGEDAAEAFGKTASDILADVANDMIRMAILEPTLNELKGKIPEMMSDGTLNDSELSEIAQYLLKIQDKYGESVEYLDELEKKINEATGGSLSIKNPQENADSLSQNIQGVTEDTANLLGSYLNSIRQDSSIKRNLMEKLMGEILPQYNVVAEAQTQQLRIIAQNTERNAMAAEEIKDLFNRVIDKGNNRIRI